MLGILINDLFIGTPEQLKNCFGVDCDYDSEKAYDIIATNFDQLFEIKTFGTEEDRQKWFDETNAELDKQAVVIQYTYDRDERKMDALTTMMELGTTEGASVGTITEGMVDAGYTTVEIDAVFKYMTA